MFLHSMAHNLQLHMIWCPLKTNLQCIQLINEVNVAYEATHYRSHSCFGPSFHSHSCSCSRSHAPSVSFQVELPGTQSDNTFNRKNAEDLKTKGAINGEDCYPNNEHGRNFSQMDEIALCKAYMNTSQNGAVGHE